MSIKSYWIVNLVDRQVVAYSVPTAGGEPGHSLRSNYGSGGEVPVVSNGQEAGRLAVSQLLPIAR